MQSATSFTRERSFDRSRRVFRSGGDRRRALDSRAFRCWIGQSQSPKPQSDSKTATPKYSIEQRQSEKLIVYVYGDPALLLHLNQAGLTAVPVSHLNLRGPNGDPPVAPTFVIIGPHAKRTKGFWDERLARASQLQEIAEVLIRREPRRCSTCFP